MWLSTSDFPSPHGKHGFHRMGFPANKCQFACKEDLTLLNMEVLQEIRGRSAGQIGFKASIPVIL